MTEDEWLADQIYSKAKNPFDWLQQAEYLFAAGNAVAQKSQYVHEQIKGEADTKKKFDIMHQFNSEAWMTFSGVMLWGFALENLAKGIIISRHKKIIRRDNNGDLKIKGIKTHDIRKLVNKCGLILSDDSCELLKLLSRVTVWGGRYPVPFGSSYKQLNMGWDSNKQRIFNDLYDELHKLLESEVEKYGQESERERLVKEKKEYARLLNELSGLKESQLGDGVVLYSATRKLPTKELTAVSCAACHAQFSVGEKVKKVAQNVISLHKPK